MAVNVAGLGLRQAGLYAAKALKDAGGLNHNP